MLRALRNGVILLLLLAAALGAGTRWALTSSLPPAEGKISLAGLSAPASVSYDRWQRPYVEANSLADAFTVQGWLHASHRLWQMELFRRAGRGRIAEMLGPELVATD